MSASVRNLVLALLPALGWAGDGPSYMKDVRPLLDTYCFACHNPEKKKGDLDLSAIASEDAAKHALKMWRGVIDQLHSHDMPPDTAKKQPSAEERDRLIAIIKGIKRYDGPPDPGRVTIRRLNRTEYDYTIRDLLGLDLRTARSSFPSDDVGEGFDNIGDVLSLPPLLLEKYLDAATTTSFPVTRPSSPRRSTSCSPPPQSLPAVVDGEEALSPDEQGRDCASSPRSSEVALSVAIPFDGKFNLKFSAGADQAGKDPAMLVVKVDNQPVKEFKITATRKAQGSLGVPLTLEKGTRRISLHFTNPFTDPEAKAEPAKKPAGGKPDRTGTGQPGVRTLIIGQVELTTPSAGGGKPTDNRRIFVAQPGDDLKPRDAAQRIVDNFASSAFRRPVTKERIDHFLTIFDLAQAQGETFEESIKYTLKAVLVSPAFLYAASSRTAPRPCPTTPTRSTTTSWPRVCPISCGPPCPTPSSSSRPGRASCMTPQHSRARPGACSRTPRPTRCARPSASSGSPCACSRTSSPTPSSSPTSARGCARRCMTRP